MAKLSKIFGTAAKPRLSVFRSNKRIAAQAIDDSKGTTIVAATDANLQGKLTKLARARKVGEILGTKLLKLGIKSVVFDRSGFLFHGRVKALAEGIKLVGIKI